MLLGADPGTRGALSLYDWRDNSALPFRLPLLGYTGNNGACADLSGTDRLDVAGLLALCATLAAIEPVACVVEDVHGYGGQNGAAAFVFGQSFGELCTALRVAGVPLVFVAPSVWKPALRVPSNKRQALARASALIPSAAHLWPLVGDDGLAEASLIAYYGAHVLGLDGCEGSKKAKRARQKFTATALEKSENGSTG